jgi:hypothetical protein
MRFVYVFLVVGAMALPSLAGSADGRKVNAPNWVYKPPTSNKGIYGVGLGQSADLQKASVAADSAACREITGLIGNTVAAWAEQARKDGDEEGAHVDLATPGTLDIGWVDCQIQKRDHRKDADDRFRAYSLGFLGKAEAVAAEKAARERQLQHGAQGSQDELDRVIKDTHAPQE